MSGRPEPPAAKRPRSGARPGSASSGSGGKLGGVKGTANAATKSQLIDGVGVGRGGAIVDDSASTTPPALFFYSNLHDAVRAELRGLLRSVADASRSEPSKAEGGNGDVDVGVGVVDAAPDALPLQTARARALADVAARAQLLERVHAYHSAVEDEVIYPALEAKVANVTLSYQVEHEDEGRLLDELVSLARSASAADAAAASSEEEDSSAAAAAAAAVLRRLQRKAAEVEATLGKHLTKEEAQLLPLVLSAFDAREQARLVAQFLCSIPLAAVRGTLAWLASASGSCSGGGGGGGGGGEAAAADDGPLSPLRASASAASAQSRIAGAVAGALPAGPLAELVASWLSEEEEEKGGEGGEEQERQQQREEEEAQQERGGLLGACGACAGCRECGLSASASSFAPPAADGDDAAAAAAAAGPLRHIAVLHAALGASLGAFAADARALAAAAAAAASEKKKGRRRGGGGDDGEDEAEDGDEKESDAAAAAAAAAALPAMADRLRFLRSVLAYHAASEDDVLMPVARRLAASAASNGNNDSSCAAAPSAAAAAAAELAAAALAAEDHHHHHHHSTDDDDEAAAGGTSGDGSRHGGGESACLERVGVLLNDVRARARRGGARAAVAASLASLAAAADGAAAEIGAHMDAEERGVLPALQRGLCAGSQAVLLWGALRSMPARVLRRLLPWLGSCLGASTARELVEDACAGAASSGGGGASQEQQQQRQQRAEARLLRSWCEGLEQEGGGEGELQLLSLSPLAAAKEKEEETAAKRPRTAAGRDAAVAASKKASVAVAAPAPDAAAVAVAPEEDEKKDDEKQQEAKAAAAATTATAPAAAEQAAPKAADTTTATATAATARQHHHQNPPSSSLSSDGDAPIDHIFQFHKALRRDLREMEREVAAFADALDAEGGSGWRSSAAAAEEEEEERGGDNNNGEKKKKSGPSEDEPSGASPAAARALEGRFRFLQGVYKAHSDAEDNIVFPALEAREALRRVSHAYTLDHEQEAALFAGVERHLLQLLAAPTLAEARAAARDLAARTAALRASLETHVTAEERELWPLFAENFTAEEQEALVGTIVGRTGAEVLAATLPWVAAATTPSEAAAMWESLRSAARGTAFDEWLRASRTVEEGEAREEKKGKGNSAGGPVPASPGRGKQGGGRAAQPGDALDAVVEYLGLAKKKGGEGEGGGSGGDDAAAATATAPNHLSNSNPSSATTTFRPGWEAIFAMNQAQLESAVRSAWTDESLEPARRAYLAQNLMAARFVVSQQRRAALAAASQAQAQQQQEESGAAAANAAPQAAARCDRSHDHHHEQHASDPGKNNEEKTKTNEGASGEGGPASSAPPPLPSPCPHYSRRTRVISPCCCRAHGCRHCHDEAEDHRLVPSQISSMLCAHCGSQVPAAADCARCGRRQARYFCGICRLWDDTPGRDIYHCPFCNLCRLGKGLGVDAQHCMRCNSCMALKEHANHACRRLPEACPACAEPLFDSPRPYRQFPCGHHMHSHCFEKWARGSYACPVCRRSVGDMTAYWRMLDALLERDRNASASAAAVAAGGGAAAGDASAATAAAATGDNNSNSPSGLLALPPALASKKQPILCNDCGSKGEASFHFVYHKCGGCGSYNTTLL